MDKRCDRENLIIKIEIMYYKGIGRNLIISQRSSKSLTIESQWDLTIEIYKDC